MSTRRSIRLTRDDDHEVVQDPQNAEERFPADTAEEFADFMDTERGKSIFYEWMQSQPQDRDTESGGSARVPPPAELEEKTERGGEEPPATGREVPDPRYGLPVPKSATVSERVVHLFNAKVDEPKIRDYVEKEIVHDPRVCEQTRGFTTAERKLLSDSDRQVEAKVYDLERRMRSLLQGLAHFVDIDEDKMSVEGTKVLAHCVLYLRLLVERAENVRREAGVKTIHTHAVFSAAEKRPAFSKEETERLLSEAKIAAARSKVGFRKPQRGDGAGRGGASGGGADNGGSDGSAKSSKRGGFGGWGRGGRSRNNNSGNNNYSYNNNHSGQANATKSDQ